ncbi:hypothetical protein N9242_04640 [Vicingaceae bacterium]|nr:hypothetical protein [Vicingaceae bacterium]
MYEFFLNFKHFTFSFNNYSKNKKPLQLRSGFLQPVGDLNITVTSGCFIQEFTFLASFGLKTKGSYC